MLRVLPFTFMPCLSCPRVSPRGDNNGEHRRGMSKACASHQHSDEVQIEIRESRKSIKIISRDATPVLGRASSTCSQTHKQTSLIFLARASDLGGCDSLPPCLPLRPPAPPRPSLLPRSPRCLFGLRDTTRYQEKFPVLNPLHSLSM